MVEFSFEISIVGSGMTTKFHAKAIKAIAGTRLVATYFRRDRVVTNFITRHGDAAYADDDKFLIHDSRDIVDIAPPAARNLGAGWQRRTYPQSFTGTKRQHL